MRNLTSITSFFIILFISKIGIAQTENKDVTITASGSGFTIEAAKQSALRSATEQAFGAFISSKTEMFNDQIVADQISSVSSGNIKSYEVLNESELPNGKWAVTLKAIVSVDKLTSFVEAKGVAIEIKGGLFALNIKQQLLNEQSEIQAVAEMVGLLHEPMQMAFDYAIKSGEPKSIDAESKNWEIPLTVTATCNKNMDFCANYFIKSLNALSLSAAEVESYKVLNKQIFTINVNYQKQSLTFILRKESSVRAIQFLNSNWNFYTKLFAVASGLDVTYGKEEGKIISFSNWSDRHLDNYSPSDKTKNSLTIINFPTSGIAAGTFSWKDKRTLSQIEQMTGYSVKPRGVISNYKNGGFVIFEKEGHGLVASLFDIGHFNWLDAKTTCDELFLNGYGDWRLPTIEELKFIYENTHKSSIGRFTVAQGEQSYWSSWSSMDDLETGYSWGFDFRFGEVSKYIPKTAALNVRVVRDF
jgi:hypothetical protein